MGRRDQVSAGLIAFRRRGEIEVLLGHPGGPYWARKDLGAWTIPKGLVNSGNLLECAMREFYEETGFVAKGPFIPLAPVRQSSGKAVHAFAFEGDFDLQNFSSNTFELEWPPRSGSRQSFPEIDRVDWFGPKLAMEKIIGYQRPLLRELNEKLGADEAAMAARRRLRPLAGDRT
jgi:predicted NUDIX family NTP pyrophosphohydrolase